ncbi:hypothetical protein CYMTET_41085 [Cymbomonas tetramitiformis]|uniref:Uncharacterized protein n=1 Tax=Cymbomonas tetramitiformis TaxID=36881 RepID=A0AAE0F2B5_9CHLO|nr:hypothetical protein CYMTET_41085 [Cymbomonas tetramitiformis]
MLPLGVLENMSILVTLLIAIWTAEASFDQDVRKGTPPSTGAQRALTVYTRANFKSVQITEGQESDEIPVTVTYPCDLTVEIRATAVERQGANAAADPAVDIFPARLKFEKGGEEPLTQSFTLKGSRAGSFNVHFTVSGIDAYLVTRLPSPILLRVTGRGGYVVACSAMWPLERFSIHPKMDVLYENRVSRQYTVAIQRQQNVVLRMQSPNIRFEPDKLVFVKGGPVRQMFRMTASGEVSADGVEPGEMPEETEVQFTVECNLPGADKSTCDASLFHTPEAQVRASGSIRGHPSFHPALSLACCSPYPTWKPFHVV